MEIMDHFVQVSKSRLSEKHGEKYATSIKLFKDSLHRDTEEPESVTTRELMQYVPQFLTYFMVRKVSDVGKKDLQGAATVIKNLFMWMKHNEYIDEFTGDMMIDETKSMHGSLGEAEDFFEEVKQVAPAPNGTHARDYMTARLDFGGKDKDDVGIVDLVKALSQAPAEIDLPPAMNPRVKDDTIAGLFRVVKVKPGKLYTINTTGNNEDIILIKIPEHLSKKCRRMWIIEAVLAKEGRNWTVKEMWAVYTHWANPHWSAIPIGGGGFPSF